MTAPHSVDRAALLEQHLADASPDLLRQMIAPFANAMMSGQADHVCGAGYGERINARVNRRNGYRPREWDTRAGTVELAIPNLCRSPSLSTDTSRGSQSPADQPAFHLVLPSLPGYGFSGKPNRPGWNLVRIADAWAELMTRLGYDRFLAQGGN